MIAQGRQRRLTGGAELIGLVIHKRRETAMDQSIHVATRKTPWWNKGKLVGQKAPLTLKDIWAIRHDRSLLSMARLKSA